jgi:MGT family glycosyltransferase
VNPTVPFGAALSARGHEVAWAGLPGVVDELLPSGSGFVPVVGGLDRAAFEEMTRQGRGLRGAEALKYLWEGFIVPAAQATAPALHIAAEAFDPDVMVVDQQAVAGAVVARRLQRHWVTSATTSAELSDPLAALPKVATWVHDQLRELQVSLGIDPQLAASGDLRRSDQLIVAFTTEALTGPIDDLPQTRFVGPSIQDRPDPTPFPWEWLAPGVPTVLVSLGTVNAEIGQRFFAAAVEAVAGMAVQAVVVAPPGLVEVPPEVTNVMVAPRVPQLALMPHLAAVVSHGGHNTVCEALAYGVPLVVAPIRDDQGIVAQQVVDAGAGTRVRFGRVRSGDLSQALTAVLSDPAYRRRARAVGQSFAQAGGAAAAADAVESILMPLAVRTP